MQIFEYDLKLKVRGRKVGDLKFNGNGKIIGKSGKIPVHEHFTSIHYTDGEPVYTDHTAEWWGVDAVSMCTGKLDGLWLWIIVPCRELVDKAIIRNLKRGGKEYYKEPK